ncbi:MAG: hypothetical protein D6780_02845 [Candidatus Dadabacteria bacterium]|nr:MAG: hypothetical protein D6780_02845 [Candidatus Dadabacteria bacterium]
MDSNIPEREKRGEGLTLAVQCPSCQTRFRVKKSIFIEGRARFRCSRCGEVFNYSLAKNLKERNLAENKENKKKPLPLKWPKASHTLTMEEIGNSFKTSSLAKKLLQHSEKEDLLEESESLQERAVVKLLPFWPVVWLIFIIICGYFATLDISLAKAVRETVLGSSLKTIVPQGVEVQAEKIVPLTLSNGEKLYLLKAKVVNSTPYLIRELPVQVGFFSENGSMILSKIKKATRFSPRKAVKLTSEELKEMLKTPPLKLLPNQEAEINIYLDSPLIKNSKYFSLTVVRTKIAQSNGS